MPSWIRGARMCAAIGAGLTGALSQGAAHADTGEGSVDVGGVHILTVRFPAAGMTVAQRADAITERLVPILSDPTLKPADIYAVPLGHSAVKIMVKNRLLVTIDEQTAKFNTTTPAGLGAVWVAHLRRVLPEVNALPNPSIERKATSGASK